MCVTRGWFDPRLADKPAAPGGKNRDLKLGQVNWRNLDTVREDELRRSVGLLGVRVLRMLDYAEEGLAKVDLDELVGRIVQPIRMHRPEVILTFGHAVQKAHELCAKRPFLPKPYDLDGLLGEIRRLLAST